MNTGIQDAYNLGWKLGLVVAGKAAPGLLDTYEEERLPIASEVLHITSELLEEILAAIRARTGGLDAATANDLTQLTLGYPWSRLSVHSASPTGPRAGDRAPDAPVRDAATGTPIRLFDLFRGPHFTLLGLGAHRARTLDRVDTDMVRPVLVGTGDLGVLDEGGHVARAYGSDALVLVRPDGYIGLIARSTDPGSVTRYLRDL